MQSVSFSSTFLSRPGDMQTLFFGHHKPGITRLLRSLFGFRIKINKIQFKYILLFNSLGMVIFFNLLEKSHKMIML